MRYSIGYSVACIEADNDLKPAVVARTAACRGLATSEGAQYELGPGDMLLTKAGDEHSLVVTEKMVAVYLYGIMPPVGRFGYLYRGVDPSFEEWQRQKEAARSSVSSWAAVRMLVGRDANPAQQRNRVLVPVVPSNEP
jgi:hypothetical protein